MTDLENPPAPHVLTATILEKLRSALRCLEAVSGN